MIALVAVTFAGSCATGVAATLPSGALPIVSIAFVGPLSGPLAPLAQPAFDAARLAVNEANRGRFGQLPVEIELVREDTRGDPARAAALAGQIADDSAIIGVIGPALSSETEAMGHTLNGVLMPFVTPSAGASMAHRGWSSWFQAIATTSVQGSAAAQYIEQRLQPNCVLVASDEEIYGSGLANAVHQGLDAAGVQAPETVVANDGSDDAALVGRIKATGCSVVFFGGYSPQADRIRSLMDGADLKGVTLAGGDGIMTSSYLAAAGAGGTVAVCACADARSFVSGRAGAFVKDFTATYGRPPGVHAAEAWDVATMFVAAFKAARTTRSSVRDFLRSVAPFPGVANEYRFLPSGELASTASKIVVYADRGGTWSAVSWMPQS